MKNKKNLIIYSVIGVVAIITVILAILYFTTDIFKSNQQLFYKYLGQIKIIDMNLINKYSVVNNVLSEESNSSNMKVKMLNMKNDQETQISDIQEVFNIDSKGLKNTLLNQSYRDFVFSNNNKTFLTIKCLRDNNTYGIIADNILGKYLSVDNDGLKELFSKLKVSDTNIIPDTIATDYKEFLKSDETILEQIKEIYFNLIYENIKKENYYQIKNKDKTQVLGVSLSEQELFNIIKLMLDRAKNDNNLLNLIANKLQFLNYEDINIEIIQSEIQKYIDKINNNTYSLDKDYIKIFFAITEEKVLNIEVEIKYKIETNTDEENQSNNEYKKSFKLNLEETNSVSFIAKENDEEIFNIVINYIYDNEKINLYTETDLYKDKEKYTLKLQYQISDYQTDNIKKVAIIDIISSDEKYQIDINNNITLKGNVQISKLTTENSAKINSMTSEEIEQIKNALLNRINELYSVDLRKVYDNIIKR